MEFEKIYFIFESLILEYLNTVFEYLNIYNTYYISIRHNMYFKPVSLN